MAAIDTNPELAVAMQLIPVLATTQLKATVLYCGPYDLEQFARVSSGLMSYFISQIGWSYFGTRHWRSLSGLDQVSTVKQVTKDYPPTYVTDGNSGSFEASGRALLARLNELGVHTDSLFYDVDEVVLPHEYQFAFTDHP